MDGMEGSLISLSYCLNGKNLSVTIKLYKKEKKINVQNKESSPQIL